MTGIGDFVKMAARTLGQSEDSTRSATAALLAGIQEKAEPNDFQQLLNSLPGASDLMGGARPEGGGGGIGGGALGAVLGKATSALGGDPQPSLGVLASIQKSGFSAGKVAPLVSLFMGFVRSNAGDGLVRKLLAKVPELGKLGN